MIDNIYKDSFKEVYDILQNTDEELVMKIPITFINFIKNNMNENYKTNINPNARIDSQNLSKETEAILSLIFRSYWATDEEKREFAIKDKQDLINSENAKKKNYKGKDIYELFEKKENLNNIILNNDLVVLEKENFIKRFFNKILNIFKK